MNKFINGKVRANTVLHSRVSVDPGIELSQSIEFRGVHLGVHEQLGKLGLSRSTQGRIRFRAVCKCVQFSTVVDETAYVIPWSALAM